MPTSHPDQLTPITQLIVYTRPRSLLDVGVGFGKYGFLAREYLEIWGHDRDYHSRTVRIDGIEAFEKYLTPVHAFAYDRVHVGEALDILPRLDVRYDLLLLIDVLEHFDHESGVRLMRLCLDRARNLIISTPRDIGVQGDTFGNRFETHRFQWTAEHLAGFGPHFFLSDDHSHLAYIGEDADRVRRTRRSEHFHNKIRRNKRSPIKKNYYKVRKWLAGE